MKTPVLIIAIVLPLFFWTPIHSQTMAQKFSVSQQSLPPLITTEQEVRQFFENYIELYMGRNIDGFLRLFSPKAVQNQGGGLPRIREIYGNFFDQSRALRYRMEDTKVEIYENAVEVKALYEVEQTKKSGEIQVQKGHGRWVLTKESGVLKIFSFDYRTEKSP